MPQSEWLRKTSPAFQLMVASSWIAPDSHRHLQDCAVRRACDAGPNWTEYLSLVDRHRTSASSWAALKRTSNLHVPGQVKRELQRRSDRWRWQSMAQLQLLAEIIKHLARSGISVMPLKGPLLSFALYGDAGLRQCNDLDVLVPEGQIRRTQECLESMGWRLDPAYSCLSPRQWDANFRRDHHLGYLLPQQGCQLELHWRWHSLQNVEQYWARSGTIELLGFSCRQMSHVDLPIYLCDHGGAHQWFRAKWLGDLARLYCNGHVDWVDVLELARRSGQEPPVRLGLLLLSECYDLAFPNLPEGLPARLPYSLVSGAVRALTARTEPYDQNAWVAFKEGIRTCRYYRALWPQRPWSERLRELLYSRRDFKVLPLPDRVFWLYMPLRPFLWAWRHMRRTGREVSAYANAKFMTFTAQASSRKRPAGEARGSLR